MVFLLIYDSANRLVSKEFEVFSPNLPAQFDGFRIALVADLHAKEFGENNKKLFKYVAEANPDIIAVVGDVLDDKNQDDYARNPFLGLTDIAPVYYVAGNHEWACGAMKYLPQLLSECGVTYFSNSFTILKNGEAEILLAGREDPNSRSDLEPAESFWQRLNDAADGRYTLLLSHRNKTPEFYYPSGADLVLSGHAHGGQIRLPFTDGLIDASRQWFPKYTSGAYEYGEMTLFVSRGLGNSVPFPRLFNPPDLPVIILRKS